MGGKGLGDWESGEGGYRSDWRVARGEPRAVGIRSGNVYVPSVGCPQALGQRPGWYRAVHSAEPNLLAACSGVATAKKYDARSSVRVLHNVSPKHVP